MKYLLLLLPLLCHSSQVHPEERGLFGDIFGLGQTDDLSTLTGLLTANSTSPTTPSTTDTNNLIGSLIDVLSGTASALPLDLIKSFLGLDNPVPSPLSDPIGFLMHPLIMPIILSAVTLNPAGLALAMGALGGNMALMQIFSMAEAQIAG